VISLKDAVDKWNNLESRSRLRAGYAVILVLALAMAWTTLAEKVSKVERKRIVREQTLKELMSLKAVYMASKTSYDLLSGRLSAVRQDDTPAKILEEIGISGKGLKITPLKSEERNGILEEAADIRIDNLTANETINLFYRLEKGSRPVLIKKANIRVRFDDPSRFDLLFTAVLLKQPATKAKAK
jgi:general secretion pathway protein M